MVNVGIIGATGYAGEELISILLRHPEARIVYLGAKIENPERIDSIFPRFANLCDLICEEPDYKTVVENCDLVFLALPHTASMAVTPNLLKYNKKVIDLSADYRLKDIKTYEKFYKLKHKDKGNINKAVYGLPELYREKIKKAGLIANPGCYPTAAILGIVPALISEMVEADRIIVDAKSGVTGAGRKAVMSAIFSEVNENFKAYKINIHQHMPEINQELSKFSNQAIDIDFVPHLLPVNRGIIATIYLRFKNNLKPRQIIDVYKRFYKTQPFVRVLPEGSNPQLKDVVHTNFCDLGININEKKKSLTIVVGIDNLLKGASGQAVQNMNIMYGFSETEALI